MQQSRVVGHDPESRNNAGQGQLRRFNAEKIFANAAMTPRMIRTHCQIDSASESMLELQRRVLVFLPELTIAF